MSASTRVRALPRPPFYACILTSRRNGDDPDGYARIRALMTTSASLQPGFLGMDSARDGDGFGISVSYWDSEDAIRAWRARHQSASLDRNLRDWFDDYDVKVARVERMFEWLQPD